MFPWHLDLIIFRPWMEGLYFAIAIIVAWWVAVQIMKQHKMDLENGEKLLGWAVAAAFLGARLSHFIFWNPERFMDFFNIFMITEGGFSITGGLIGGFIGGYIYAKVSKMDFYGIFARLSPAVLLGQAIGRIGCFLNGDAHGTATTLPWGVEFPRYGTNIPSFQLNTDLDSPAYRWALQNDHVASFNRTLPLHPTQLYEAFLTSVWH
jgi:phosphatidylglycerol:prolipoprotein diacylglycerol transferase